jgi:predicted anti-sigma-YlaC factor YlaD
MSARLASLVRPEEGLKQNLRLLGRIAATMECLKCLELLSEFLDGRLSTEDRQLLTGHLDECLPCAFTHQDFNLIIKLARELRDEFPVMPPLNMKTVVFSSAFQRPIYS